MAREEGMSMRRVTFAAAALLALVPGAAGAAEDGVAERLARLTRGAKWEQKAAVAVGFPTFHPQGFAAVGEDLFVSSVEIVEPTQRFPQLQGGYDRTPGK